MAPLLLAVPLRGVTAEEAAAGAFGTLEVVLPSPSLPPKGSVAAAGWQMAHLLVGSDSGVEGGRAAAGTVGIPAKGVGVAEARTEEDEWSNPWELPAGYLAAGQ